MSAINNLIGLLKDLLLINFVRWVWNQIKPKSAFAWQTLILLSLFSWLMSLLTPTTFVKEALSSMGWLFLTLGVGWALSDKKIPIAFLDITLYPGPWVSGALTCIFLREGWKIPSSTAYILWPTISAIIASLSKFLKPGPTLAVPSRAGRQQIVLLLLSNAIVSCWFGFHFLIQDWLRQFPSVGNEDFSRSTFVNKMGSRSNQSSRGAAILDAAASQIATDLQSRPWAEVERWLLNINAGIAAIESQVKSGLADAEENQMWSLKGQVPPGLPQYTVVLQAVWQGPSAFANGYYLQKSCLVTRLPSLTAGAQVQCEPAIGPFPSPTSPAGT